MDRLKIFAILICFACSVAARHMEKEPEDAKKVNFRTEGTMTGSEKMHSNETYDSELVTILNACNMTYPTPAEYLMELNETGRFPANAPRDAKCYLNCVFTRLKLLDEDGNPDASMIDKWFVKKDDTAEGTTAFEDCFMKHGGKHGDVCEHSYERFSCLMRKAILSENVNKRGGKDDM